ncbi:YciC family protein [Pseudomonas sp. Marseille-QA0892]
MNPLRLYRDAWYFASQNLLAIALLCLPFIALECALQRALAEWFDHETPPVYSVLLSLVIYPLYSGALILFMEARTRGELPSAGALWRVSASMWPRLGLLVGISTLLIMLGLTLFILPALWVMTRLAFAEYVVVIDGQTPLQAMRDSYELSRGYFWVIFVCLMTVMVPMWAIDLWLAGTGDQPRMDAVGEILTGTVAGFIQLFSSIVMYRLYMLRQEKLGTKR